MPVNIRSSSRLSFGKLLLIDGVEHWDTLVLPDQSPRSDDIIHVVSSADRIDLIAYRYYQDASLWWIIAWANDMEVLPTDLNANDEIRIPSKSYVEQAFLNRKRR